MEALQDIVHITSIFFTLKELAQNIKSHLSKEEEEEDHHHKQTAYLSLSSQTGGPKCRKVALEGFSHSHV